VYVSYQDEYGLSVQGAFTPDHDGRVEEAVMVAAGREVQAFVFPPSFDTGNWPPAAHPQMQVGHQLRLHADVLPRCDADLLEAPVITVTSKAPDGSVFEDRLVVVEKGRTVADMRTSMDDIARQFCSQGVVARVSSASASADHETARITYVLRNPGPETVTVRSRAWESALGARWLPASVTVPADGADHHLKISGEGGICATDDPLVLGIMSAIPVGGDSYTLHGPAGGLSNTCG